MNETIAEKEASPMTSRFYLFIMVILGLGIGVVGFFYIHLLDQKHRVLVECYETEAEIRDLTHNLQQVFHEFHEVLAAKDIEHKIEDFGMNIQYANRVIDLNAPKTGVIVQSE